MLPKPMPAPNDGQPRQEGFSVKQVATIVGVHEDTIRRLIKAGKLTAVRVGEKLLRIPRSELARLRKERSVPPHTSADTRTP